MLASFASTNPPAADAPRLTTPPPTPHPLFPAHRRSSARCAAFSWTVQPTSTCSAQSSGAGRARACTPRSSPRSWRSSRARWQPPCRCGVAQRGGQARVVGVVGRGVVLHERWRAASPPRTQSRWHTHSLAGAQELHDPLALLLMVRINREHSLAMSRRRNPALDGFFDRLNLMLWPRLKVRGGQRRSTGATGSRHAACSLAQRPPSPAPLPPLPPPPPRAWRQALLDVQLASVKALHPSPSTVDSVPRLHPLTGARQRGRGGGGGSAAPVRPAMPVGPRRRKEPSAIPCTPLARSPRRPPTHPRAAPSRTVLPRCRAVRLPHRLAAAAAR